MENKSDWKKLEKEQKIKDSSIIQKYGFDIKKYTEKTFSKEVLEKRKKRNKLIKILIVLIILLTIFIQINSVNMKIKASVREKLKNDIEQYYNEEVEIISEKTYWRGNGFYTLKTKNTPNIEMHVVIDGENTSNDLEIDIINIILKNGKMKIKINSWSMRVMKIIHIKLIQCPIGN